jgi:hypothetical protein
MGARSQGMAYASAAIRDSWGMFNNVAGISGVTETTATFSYKGVPALPGANRTSFSLLTPTRYGVAGVGVFRFGDDLYNESLLTAGFSNQLGLASLGVRVNYIQYRAEGFGTKGVFTVNVGGIADLTPRLAIGAHITNLNQPKISIDGDRIPTLLTTGVLFKPTDKVMFATELEKDLDYKPTWKLGGEYRFHPKFCARTGFNLYPNASFFGMGFKTSRFLMDYAFQYSTAIQFSHQASIIYQFSRS